MQENVFPSSGDWLSGWKWLAYHDNGKERWSLFFQCCNIYKKPVVTKITNIEITNIFVLYALPGDYLYFAFWEICSLCHIYYYISKERQSNQKVSSVIIFNV